MKKEAGISVNTFRDQLRTDLEELCKSQGKNYSNNQARGFAFQTWVADLLMGIHDLEDTGQEHVFTTNDLKVDVAFDEEESKTLCLAQTKCESITTNPDVDESQVTDFFSRHEILLKDREWVRQNASEDLNDLVADYAQRVTEGWNITLYFVSTGKASDRIRNLVTTLDARVKSKHSNVSFVLFDFFDLKEQFIRSRSLEQSITESVDIHFAEDSYIEKDKPHPTMVAVVKGNTLVNLYRKERERLFAYNIRSFLGKRINKAIVETAANNPSEFFISTMA